MNALAALLQPPSRVTMATIKAAVARDWRVTVLDLESMRQGQEFARPRQVTMYLARHLTALSSVQIGRLLGDRDHTTVLHGVKRITALRGHDEDLNRRVAKLWKQISPPAPIARPELQPAFFDGPLFDLAPAPKPGGGGHDGRPHRSPRTGRACRRLRPLPPRHR